MACGQVEQQFLVMLEALTTFDGGVETVAGNGALEILVMGDVACILV